MKEPLNIEELFKEKLHNLEASPKANAWASIQNGLSTPAASTAAVASSASWVGTAIVASVLTVLTVGGFFYFNAQGEKSKQNVSTEKENVVTPETKETISESKAIIQNKTIESSPEKETKVPLEIKKAKATVLKNNSESTSEIKSDQPTTEKVTPTTEVSEQTIDEIIAENQIVDSEIDNDITTDESVSEPNMTTDNKKLAKSSEDNANENTAESDKSETNSRAKEILADKFLFPNVCTPGADGINDDFRMNPEKLDQIDNVEIKIFSLSGKLVGQWVGKYNSWNGNMLNGTPAPAGNYSYQAVITIDSKAYPKPGTFTLIR